MAKKHDSMGNKKTGDTPPANGNTGLPKRIRTSKRTILRTRDSYVNNKNYLCSIGADFEVTASGSTTALSYEGREFLWVDVGTTGGQGHHLSKQFLKDIDAWIAQNKGNVPRWDNNYKEQMFNLDAIEGAVGKPLVMIDINDCYWRTAYILGYITQLTYITGKKNKSWKIGRNACIGGLAKVKVTQGYTKGKIDPTRRKVVRTPVEYQMIRNHIIGHVYKMFNDLFEQMGDSFFMFLTDCVVTTYDKKRWVEEYFTQMGYRTKSKPVEFTGLDRAGKRVIWWDFTGKSKTLGGGEGVERYYQYASRQVVNSTLVSSLGHFGGV